jgi:O-antigen/teichoic acid export membrane protein
MRRNALYLLAGRLSTLASGLLAGVLLARVLRPAGQGAFTLFATSAGMVGELSFAGLYASLVYHIGRSKSSWREYASGWLTLLLLLALGLNLAGPWIGGRVSFIPGRPGLFWLMLNLGLVLAFAEYGRATLAGREDFRPIMRYDALRAGLQIPGLLVGMLLFRPGAADAGGPARLLHYVSGAAAGYMGANLLAAVFLGGWLFRGGLPLRLSLRPLLPLLAVGGNAFLVRILSFLLLRSDTYLVNYLRNPYQLGLYARAVGLVELLLVVPNVVGFALFPRVAASGKRAGEEVTVKTLRCLLPFVAAAAAVLGGGGWRLLVCLYGAEFGEAYPALVALLPGLVGMAYAAVAANYLAGLGYPRRFVVMHAIAFGLNLALNLWWIPRWGIIGAGLASSVAYGLLAWLLVRELLLRSGLRARAVLVPTWRELRDYLSPSRRGSDG